MLWVKRGLAYSAHTLTIKALPAAGHSVNLDALDVWQDTCSYTTPGQEPAGKR